MVVLNQLGETYRLPRITAPPAIHISRDCDDIVLRLFGEPETTYTLQSSTDGRTWNDLAPWSLRHPPHREPANADTRLFRLSPPAP